MLINDYNNSRYVPDSEVNSSNVGMLKQAWHVDLGEDVTSQPIVADGGVYFTDWSGNVISANLTTGRILWNNTLGTQLSGSLAVRGGMVYGGGQPRIGLHPFVFALNQANGKVIWNDNLTQISNATMTSVWASPTLYKGMLYVGTAGNDNTTLSKYKGQMVALNETNGNLIWNFSTMVGTSGGAPVWGSVVVDPALNSIYFGTGDPYTNTKSINYSESIISLDATSGKLNWVYRTLPKWDNNDTDLGSTPNLFTLKMKNGSTYQALGIGSKGGNYYIVDRTTGNLIEQVRMSIGGDSSGIIGLAGFYYPTPNNPEIFAAAMNQFCNTQAIGCTNVTAYFPATNTFAWNRTDN